MKLTKLSALLISMLLLTSCSTFPDYWFLGANLSKTPDMKCIEKVLTKHTPKFEEFFSKAPFGSWLRRNSDLKLRARRKELLGKKGSSMVVGFGFKEKKIRFGIAVYQGALRQESSQTQTKFLTLVPKYKNKVRQILDESSKKCDLGILRKEISSNCKGLLCK